MTDDQNIYPDSLAERFIGRSEPYSPSNGTEGMMFEENFCDRCVKDRLYRETGDFGCTIHNNALFLPIADKDYPKEWTHDAETGQPTCTAFERDWNQP